MKTNLIPYNPSFEEQKKAWLESSPFDYDKKNYVDYKTTPYVTCPKCGHRFPGNLTIRQTNYKSPWLEDK